MTFTIGLEIGPYRIMEQLGQGGMAVVYKAYHAALDRYVAIKVLHQAFLEDANFQARFQREARLVARLEHPNIVPIYDFAEYERQPYLVMKYIEGETLKARLQRGALNASEIRTIVEAVGAGLHYAHKQNILHRDIKPSNVILSNDGGIYLADFGLARIAQSAESTLSNDIVLGTPQYISPEQAMAKKDLDEGTDIYSFGVMLYELTVGRVPFSADTPFSVIHDHIYTPLPMPRTVNPHLSPEVERVLLKALAKERADRYQNVPELVEAFTKAWEGSASTLAAPLPEETISFSDAPAARSAGSAPLTRAAVKPAPAEASTMAAAPLTQSASPWPWIISGVVIIALLLTGGLWLVRRANRQPAPVVITNTQAATAPLPANPVEKNTQPAAKTPVPTREKPRLQEIGELPPLEEAAKAVEKDPANPQAHIIYGLTLMGAGQDKNGLDEIVKASDLAAKDARFLTAQGSMLMLRRQWLSAAILYVRATRLIHIPEEALYASVYFGFEENLAPDYLPYNVLQKTDPVLALTAQIRYTMVRINDLPAAQKLIDDLRETAPDKPITSLLQAELSLKNRDLPSANKILDNLLKMPNLPEWIRLRANELKK